MKERKKNFFSGKLVYIAAFLLVVTIGVVLVLVLGGGDDKPKDSGGTVSEPPSGPGVATEVCIDRNCTIDSADLRETEWLPIPNAFAGQIATELQPFAFSAGDEGATIKFKSGQVSFKACTFCNKLVYGMNDGDLKRLFNVVQNFSGDPVKTVLDIVTKPESDEIELIPRVFVSPSVQGFTKAMPDGLSDMETDQYGDRAWIRVTDSRLYAGGCNLFCNGPGTATQLKTNNQINYCMNTDNCTYPNIESLGSSLQRPPIDGELRSVEGLDKLSVAVDSTPDPFVSGHSDVYGNSFIGSKEPFSQRDLNLISESISNLTGVPQNRIGFFMYDLEAWAGFANDTSLAGDFKFFYYVNSYDADPVPSSPGDAVRNRQQPNHPEPTRGISRSIFPSTFFVNEQCPPANNCDAL